MEVVTGATSSLLPKLGSLLQEEYKLQDKVKKDIESLQKELIFMNATLLMVAEVPPERIDPLAKAWATLIKELSYDMEDVVKTFMAELHCKGPADLGGLTGIFKKALNMVCMGTSHHRIAGMIEEMKSLTKELTELRDRYRLENIHIGPTTTESLLAGMNPGNGNSSSSGSSGDYLMPSRQLIHTKEPVGAVGDMKRLREWLTKHSGSEKHRSVLSLFGIGGVGKTTIATALYREFSNEFDCRASVTLSQNYDDDEVLRDILHQIKTADMPVQIKPRNREQGQQGGSGGGSLDKKAIAEEIRSTVSPGGGSLEKKNIAADIRSAVSQFVPLICGLSKQVTDSSSDFTKNKIETMDHGQLVEVLKTCLSGKRYLLLIDDVWSTETWEKIKIWLPYDNRKDSRVIVTTRFKVVGAACSDTEGTDLLHTVSFLNHDDSRSLFYQSVSTSDIRSSAHGMSTDTHNTVDEHAGDSRIPLDHSVFQLKNDNGREKKEAVGKIWEYCGGLPLAIVTMAGLVSCNLKQNDVYWSKIFQEIFPQKVAPLTLDGVTTILDYCYNNMPPEMRTCSLYLSIFPKGMTISRKRLARRWISECFVTEKQGLTAEEVAETYFSQLISRKIIRPVDHSSNGKVKSFKVHDMILEYIVSKSSEENFITVVGGHGMMPTPSYKVRRLSMQSSGSKHGSSTKGMNLSQVRSMTAFGSKNQRLPLNAFNNGIIQVLDLEGWKGLEQKHLSDICRMVVLKYLSLRRTEVSEIPSQIDKLEHLETLDIRETNVAVLPKNFGRLKLLRSMLGGSKNPRKTVKLSQVTNNELMKGLRILSGIEITEESAAAVASLHQLTGLRKLGIYKLNIQKGSKTFKQLLSSIEHLCSYGLNTLAINDEGSEFINSLDSMSDPPRYLIALELSGKMEKTPKWIKDLSNLYKLTLSVTVLQTKTFELIRDLPKLFSLTFTLRAAKHDQDILDILEKNKQLTDREIIVPPGGFRSLKLLRFFATLVPRISFAVKETEKVMPALERIEMRFQAFEGIYGIGTLESLQEVHLSVDSQADEITKFLVDDLKDTQERVDKECYKCPKIIIS